MKHRKYSSNPLIFSGYVSFPGSTWFPSIFKDFLKISRFSEVKKFQQMAKMDAIGFQRRYLLPSLKIPRK